MAMNLIMVVTELFHLLQMLFNDTIRASCDMNTDLKPRTLCLPRLYRSSRVLKSLVTLSHLQDRTSMPVCVCSDQFKKTNVSVRTESVEMLW